MYQADVIFRPMMPISSSAAKMSRPAVTGSLNKMKPTSDDELANHPTTENGPEDVALNANAFKELLAL